MNAVVVGLAGRRGSGKSTLAAALHSRHGFVRVSFGDHVRSLAQARGLGGDVASLEGLGRKLISELGWDRFCAAVLAGVERSHRLVVDGVRHVAASATLQRLVAPARFGLVFLDIDDAVRLRRLEVRGGPGESTRAEMTNELARLRAQADLVIDGSQDDGAARVVAWVESVSP